MRCLLDTHALLWWLRADQRLSPTATQVISDATTDVIVSAASIWEIAIKAGLGRLELPDDLASFFQRQLEINSFELLPVQLHHAAAVRDLSGHHRDPFDRLLIAQAQTERLALVSGDQHFRAYEVDILW